ncbi:snoRNA binding domain protein [Teladorsagia circumcincta]|uniref:Nucleolar protein 56 n=1 Tax=Teladorsagia circumcincta TaxID=45464 RepID=A0A2G9UCQ5_TELCI|nr:snoRNA binding domain protein [Teladorsagia circumcincta]
MVIQSIALLDQLDKDINLFGMRIREWYSYHYPELFKLVPDQYKYAKLAVTILDRNKMHENENLLAEITEILDGDEEKAAEVVEAARTSMGMDIADLDLVNIERFASRVASLTEYRQRLHEYIKDRMNSCAPSLSALIGEQVGARLISHAGSLTNLAKYPASTVQILGAEKALFRALKTRSATPKYGLLFHSSFIGRASAKNKGRISRFLANKCTIASRIDCFSEVPVSTFGEFLKGQVEERLKYFETGEVPQKNLDVMVKAQEEAKVVQEKVLKKRKKAAKKARKIQEETQGESSEAVEENDDVDTEAKEIAQTRRRLLELESIKERTYGRERTLLVRNQDTAPKCCFCGSIGEHDSDKYYKHKTIKERKQILAEATLCEVCLGLCRKPCTALITCDYCGADSHNSAVCAFPEEKQHCIEIIRQWDFFERPQCAKYSAPPAQEQSSRSQINK